MSTPNPTKIPVQQYIADKKLEPLIEKAVNAVYKAQAENPAGFLADYFRREAGPQLIQKLVGREVLDSRGNPTVECDVYVNNRVVARATAPSGASTGSNEAHELRDTDRKDRYLGKGVLTAVDNVSNKLSPALASFDPIDLKACDRALCDVDGTELKTKIGGNAITAASFAIAEAGAVLSETPLYKHLARVFHDGNISGRKYSIPTPLVNILNGGKHAGGKLKIQEFMIVPKSGILFREQLRIVTEVYHHLGKVLVEKYGAGAKNLGDEGGYAPSLDTPEEALSAIESGIVRAGYKVGEDVFLALDCAASEFYNEETKTYEIIHGQQFNSDQVLDFYGQMIEAHPALISIEDPLHEKDYDTWQKFTARFGGQRMVVGDDLYTTNTNLIRRGLEGKWANALLLKVNQIGSVSESMDAAKMKFDAGCQVIVSHRSGESPNSTIADLAVGIGARYIKTGATARGERVAKYNRLLQIEEELQASGELEIK
jgi:enolase